MKKLAKEEYKHLFTIVSNFILLCIETAMFAVVWLECYFPSIEQPSFSYENIIMIGMYALFMFMFVRGMNGQNRLPAHYRDVAFSDPGHLSGNRCDLYRNMCVCQGIYESGASVGHGRG